ncbi:MAG TPA: sigma-54 dependent transcriptional regulator [Verrucomicrobiae bacterium]|nr:sigma-54 dependent transcriptional regulator [Verrucomicrobiae bacterium]
MSGPHERVLIVDDEENVRALFKRILEKDGYDVEYAASGEEAFAHLEARPCDLVLTDLKMPGMDGMELLTRGKALRPATTFVMLTAFGTVQSAVEAMKQGAYDYLVKPVDKDEIKIVVAKALEMQRLSREVDRLRSQLDLDLDFDSIVGQSKGMKAVFRLMKMVADSNATILIHGESGTGKELIARAIHNNSRRRERRFVAVNCASVPETLLESELFGYVRGAFTGATGDKKGLFEEAHEGTLLLDEIGDTSIAFQSALLRVLQENEIRPVGSNKSVKVDVRVIVSTNKDLRREVQRKAFREDLFYRLSVVPVAIPPLRSRRDDIPLLANHFIGKFCKVYEVEPKRLAPAALRLLLDHSWPGNVRELENVIERAVLVNPGVEIAPESLFPSALMMEESRAFSSLQETMRGARELMEREKIAEALQRTSGNRSHAAKLLGISRSALYNKLKMLRLAN